MGEYSRAQFCARAATLAKKTSMLTDVVVSGDVECSIDTFSDYVGALERLFVIQDIDAWCPAIRSKTVIRSFPKRGFCDPSIAVALMGLPPEALSVQLKTFGFIFEQMCVRDLKAYTQGLYSHVSYYHDRYDLEADFVLHLEDGRYALIECKLGSGEIEVATFCSVGESAFRALLLMLSGAKIVKIWQSAKYISNYLWLTVEIP